jgi:glycyl-tRNA synthetase
VSNNVSLSLRSAVSLAAAQQPLAVSQQQQEAVIEFVSRRLEQLLVDSGVSAEAGRIHFSSPCCFPASFPIYPAGLSGA